jgi:hypothetical protein
MEIPGSKHEWIVTRLAAIIAHLGVVTVGHQIQRI